MSQERLLKLAVVISITGLSKSAIYALPDFPKPIKISTRASAWVSTEVDAWVRNTIAASRQSSSAESRVEASKRLSGRSATAPERRINV
jgi:prophage regulatory protein